MCKTAVSTNTIPLGRQKSIAAAAEAHFGRRKSISAAAEAHFGRPKSTTTWCRGRFRSSEKHLCMLLKSILVVGKAFLLQQEPIFVAGKALLLLLKSISVSNEPLSNYAKTNWRFLDWTNLQRLVQSRQDKNQWLLTQKLRPLIPQKLPKIV